MIHVRARKNSYVRLCFLAELIWAGTGWAAGTAPKEPQGARRALSKLLGYSSQLQSPGGSQRVLKSAGRNRKSRTALPRTAYVAPRRIVITSMIFRSAGDVPNDQYFQPRRHF